MGVDPVVAGTTNREPRPDHQKESPPPRHVVDVHGPPLAFGKTQMHRALLVLGQKLLA